MEFGWEIESMKFNPKAKFWKPAPNQKQTITILPKEGHQLLHDYFITNHKVGNRELEKEIRQVFDYENEPFGYDKREMPQIEPMPRFADYAKEIGGGWEAHDGTIMKTMPRIDWGKRLNWEQVRGEENWEEWHFGRYKLFHTKEFKRWSLHHNNDIIGHMPYDTLEEKAFAWAEEYVLLKGINDEKTIEESGGNPNMKFEKELSINVTLERAKIINELVPKKIDDYGTLANECSKLWNCDLSIKEAQQLLEEAYIVLKTEGIRPNFFRHRE